MAYRALAQSILSLALLFASPLVSLAADDGAKQASGEKTLADSGFRPQPGGFSFENWGGSEYPYSDLTANDAVALFGERVCARWEGEVCVPTPATKTWLKEMNEMMKGGHCEGMAALSAAFHAKQESPADFGGKQPFELSPKDRPLMSTISAYFATQALEPVQSKTATTRDWPLQKIVDTLVTTLKSGKDYPTLGIYGADGGHAVTPYKVEQRGDGMYRVFVYDNNYPGSEKYVDVDAKQDHWSYAGAALNPREDPAPWEGGSGSMDVTLLSTRYEPLACPFCGSHKPPRLPAKPPSPSHPRPASVPADSYSVITPNRCSQIQATRKKDKKQISTGKAGTKREIPGATMATLRGSRGCYVRLPANAQYDLQLVNDGRPFISPVTQLFVFALGEVYGVSNIALSQGTVQSFSLGQSGFSYQSGGTQKPTLVVATDTSRPNAYYEVSGFTIRDGYSFSAERSESGAITFSDNDPELKSFDVQGEIVSESGSEELDLVDLDSEGKSEVELEVEDDGDIDVDIDSDGDGTDDDADTDDDNDGTPDANDSDDDNDGTPDSAEANDEDFDGTPDAQDTDDDNDGTPDSQDSDDDNDGTPDAQDPDSDGNEAAGADDSDHDGTADSQDTDDDNDGTPDAQDTDDDNDGTPDADEGDDSDHDGTPDDQDADDDNDGSPDSQDTDDDNDGTPDSAEEQGDEEPADDGGADAGDAGGDDSEGAESSGEDHAEAASEDDAGE